MRSRLSLIGLWLVVEVLPADGCAFVSLGLYLLRQLYLGGACEFPSQLDRRLLLIRLLRLEIAEVLPECLRMHRHLPDLGPADTAFRLHL